MKNINYYCCDINQSTKLTSNVSKQIEEFIDEKCRNLNKSGTSKGGALHLAQWMKFQLEKQAIESEPIDSDPDDETNKIKDWSPEEVQKRSTELKLIDENGVCCKTSTVHPLTKILSENNCNVNNKNQSNSIESRLNIKCSSNDLTENNRQSPIEEKNNNNNKSPLPSRSTTPDSQVTVRSSPLSNKIDTISVCRDCVRKCKSRLSSSSSNSLLVHSSGGSAKDHKCCKNERKGSNASSTLSSASSTITGEIKTDSSHGQDKSKLISSSSNSIQSDNVSRKVTSNTSNPKTPEYRIKNATPCPCKCTPEDFQSSTLEPDTCIHETVKIFDNMTDVKKQVIISNSPKSVVSEKNATKIDECDKIEDTSNKAFNEDEDWSLMLIGLAQINPTASLVNFDPFEVVPTISVVPPTPEGANARNSNPNIWDINKLSPDDNEDQIIVPKQTQPQSSFSDDSPDEPPYLTLNTGLKRYGTMSSLERVPSEDADDKTYNSSDEDSENDIKIVTREYYTNTQSIKAWTSRAGAFLEESKAFIDRYLVNRPLPETSIKRSNDTLESSGAASSEDLWGTPTSGGEYDDAHNFILTDHNQLSPTKSSSDYSGPEEPELMMDELLMMAPPVTSSNMRGLLPRRRLEPLFEEDTESGESDDERPLNGSKAQQKFSKLEGQSMVEKTCEDGVSLVNAQIESDSSQTSTSPESSTPVDSLREQHLAQMQQHRSQQRQQPLTQLHSVARAARSLTTLHRQQNRIYGNAADKYYVSAQIIQETKITNCTEITESSVEISNVTSQQINNNSHNNNKPNDLDVTESITQSQQPPISHHLSPRLEMRLAMNRDILCEEDLMNYDAGPDLTSILGHDLSSYRRMTGKDIIMNRIINSKSSNQNNFCRSNVEHTSYYPQNHSKMDTPILNRKKSNQRIWNSSGFVEREENALSDLERLARREKIYCMTQLQNSPQRTKVMTSQTDITTSQTTPQLAKRPNKILNFFARRNSEQLLVSSASNSSRLTYEDANDFDSTHTPSSSTSIRSISPRKELERPVVDRRFWKQLQRRQQSRSFDVNNEDT
uniref:CSON004268 protein n=1 Tax=Culicoides sonorensis TaxID=179676 RepID=A0A336N172_CULSO